MGTARIIVTVSGGNVSGVFANDPNIEVYLVDYDNLRADPDQDCDIPISPSPLEIYQSELAEEIKAYPGVARLGVKIEEC
jgi:hypothetical protein